MIVKKYLLICAAVAAIAGLTANGEVLATNTCNPVACNLDPQIPQVQCGTRNGCPICLNIFPDSTESAGSCTFSWNVQNAGTTAQSAIAYQCAADEHIAATGAQGCGVGTNFAFQGAHLLDSVLKTSNLVCSNGQTNCSRFAYTINAACARQGVNSVVFKVGSSIRTCSGPIIGFGTVNINQTNTACQVQTLGDSDCQIKTCFTRGVTGNIVDHTIEIVGGSCNITLLKGTLGGGFSGVTDIPDGTVLKFGTSSCYQVTYQRKTTWVATAPTTVCP